jgi:hypothetical protein
VTVSQTTRLGIYRWSEDTDAFTRQQMDTSHANLESKAAVFTSGTALPSPNPEHARSFFFKTDTQTLYYFNGTDNTGSWVAVGQFGTTGQMATLAYGQTNSAGVIDATARVDHVHALPEIDTNALIPKSVLTTKGDLIVGSAPSTPSVQSIGSDGQVLQADSTTSTGVKWASVDVTGNVPLSVIDAKGDLIVGSSNDTVARRAVGSNGQILIADSAQTTGLRWGNDPQFQKYSEGLVSVGTYSGSTIGNAANVYYIEVGSNQTLALAAGVTTASTAYSLSLIVKNTASGVSLTFPSSVKWPNGTRPTEDTGLNKTNLWTLITYDQGTTWLGFLAGRGFS